MTLIHEAAQVLEAAEKELRGLLSRAAGDGDYEALVRIAAWAKRIGEVLAESSPGRGSGWKDSNTGPSSFQDSGSGKRLKGASPAEITGGGRDYPRFFRDGSTLVKVGWSRSRRAEYEHKAPFGVVRELLAAIVQAASETGDFAMESVLPLRSAADGGEIPGYQAYAWLAWLRHVGLVRQHGRQGYSVERRTDLMKEVEELFGRLPEYRSWRRSKV